ncbi:hypothetical protein AMS68_002271 [Peltaster fructicola]|uniref:Uncharacterized protein n=1 Tax=Peltaster fructicola TaxID=286661 RepID=A0A6H0XPU5_9PEZI|nr:hypothetical protein AMS68_002271 [Peltaster fructicola]
MMRGCATRSILRAPPWDKDIPKLVRSYVHQFLHRLQFGPEPPHIPPPLDPVSKMLQDQFLALEPFASMTADLRSRTTLAIQIPAWLMSSPYACNLLEAADATFDRVVGLESPSSAAYTALGYELCRVSHDAFDCTGPGRLATIEYDGQFAIASTTKTPTGALDHFHTQYTISRSSDPLELSEWVNSFLSRFTPDMITLAGTHTNKGTFEEALALSKAAGRFVSHDSIDAQAIMVVGAAQVAKDALENHPSDCGEFDECLAIRAEADRLAGEYVYTRPTRWPATNSRHWKRWQEHLDPATEYFPSMPFILGFNPPEL